MNYKSTCQHAGIILIALFGLLHQSVWAQTSVTVLVDSRASAQTRTSASDDLTTPVIIDLAAAGFAAGDVVEFQNSAPPPGFSNFSCNGSFKPIGEEKVVGIFSASDSLLPQDSLDRVVDAITPPGLFIALFEDSLEIPVGASHLFLSIADTFWIDNCTPGNISADFPKGAVVFTMTSKALAVGIDVKPGSDPNCFNINGHGVIPVAILGSDTFDVTLIDQSSLSFGGLEVRVRGNKGPLCSVEYSDGDAFLDLACHFEDNATNWESGDDDATLIGALSDGTKIQGTDSICVVP